MKTRPAVFVFVLTVLSSVFTPAAFQHSDAASRRGDDVQIFSLQILVNQAYQMHSLFTLLNHGMKMATDGANMIMLGRTGEPGGAKDTLQRHGRTMMQDGRVFIIRLSDNEMMQDLHNSGLTIDKSPAMASLHRSIELSLRIIDRLARI
ncbi:MAG: hypothetical protein RRA32_02485 [bacterium]|nr:hypothetical protein [bacterium]